ncbi:Cation channel sperm-associated protein 1 [Geodia barretti]|uniref:Cation channel sperm-associated protein 1 n=1 Tax=Geodia barretti TaxID=519541 RepID=A0AA35R921_GEOBA|nr:Cation channel sperm-associated protein 1 [Geodia barretti]
MSSEESTSSESESEEEAIDGEDKRKRGAPEGAPRIASGPLMEGEDDEELREEERELIAASGSRFRRFAFDLVESRWFSFSILAVIILNTVFIAVQTSKYVVAKAGKCHSKWWLMLVDQVFLAIYIVELSLKIYVWRLKFFKQFWNNFDAAIVASSLIDFLIPLIVQNIGVFDPSVFRVLRVFRAIRALRALRVLRTIRHGRLALVVNSGCLLYYLCCPIGGWDFDSCADIFAIIGRGLYGEVDPARFGNLGRACFTLFQLITLDDWFFMYSTVRDEHPEHGHIIVYLLLFTIMETFIFINLFVAVIVDNLARTQAVANATKPKKLPELDKKTEMVQESDQELHPAALLTSAGHGRGRRADEERAGEKQPKTVDDFYSPEQYSPRKRELMGRFLQLLASLEHHTFTAQRHSQVLDELVDLVDFSKN